MWMVLTTSLTILMNNCYSILAVDKCYMYIKAEDGQK
jgi:hypothetical protein